MDEHALTRRKLLTTMAVALPVGAALSSTAFAQAKPLPKLSTDDPAAKALLYVEDTTKVDKKNPLAARHTVEQKCLNCAQIQGKPGDEYRPCGIFPGKLVHANGWCSVWAKKV